MATIELSVADVLIAYHLPSDEWVAPVLARMGNFQAVSGSVPDVICHVRIDPNLAGSPGGEPRIDQSAGGLTLRHDNFEAYLPREGNPSLTIYQAELTPPDQTYVMVLDGFSRMILAQALMERGGFMLHAAGIATSKTSGYVFFGPSGSGKTTICGLSHPRFVVLCDEIIAIRPGPTGYQLFGTPFCGAWGKSVAEDVPLTELFFLKQATTTRRQSLLPHEIARALLESAIFYDKEAANVERFVDVVWSLAQHGRVTQLDFEAKESLWETVLAPTRC